MSGDIYISGKSSNNKITISGSSKKNDIVLSTKETNNNLITQNNNAKYYSDKALESANKAEQQANLAKGYADSVIETKNELLNNEDIKTVVTNIDNINTVGENIENIITIAEDLDVVADSLDVINKVNDNLDVITSVNSNVENINTVASNIEDIQNAEENSNIAKEKAQESFNYSELSKYYSEKSKEQADISISNAEISITKANESSQSASNSLKSAENSALSEASAKESENKAKTSETNAKISEQNAKSSEQRCEEIYARLGIAIIVKGRVDSFEDLPTTNVVNGDAYLVGVEGLESYPEYYWYEDHWEYMGSTEVKLEWGGITGTLSNQTDLQTALDEKANDNEVVHLANNETINGVKTFNGKVNFLGNGDSNAVYLSENTRINVHGTTRTVLGFATGTYLIGHSNYNTLIRGKGERPYWGTGSNISTATTLALTSDIPDVSKFITMQDVEAKGYLTEVPSEYVTDTELSTYAYDKATVDGKIAEAVTGGTVDLSGYAKDSEVVHLANTETISGAKTFTQPIKIQNGAGTGSLIIGGDVNAGTLTNGTRKLARIAVPTQTNKDLMATLLGFDSNGDDALHIKNRTYDAISFGGQTKITNATSPMSLGFCVAKTRNGTAASDKIYTLEMDSSEARFNVQPNYNGVNLATTVDVTNALNGYAKLTDIPDVSNLATKDEIPTYTAGENITIENGVISASGGEIDTSNLATKTDVANKQDKFSTSLPLTMGGLKTSTTNISYDNNGKAYLNDVAYYSTLPELLPSSPLIGTNTDIRASFTADSPQVANPILWFTKLKGTNGDNPILNLDGYNAIIHEFKVGDIVMGDQPCEYANYNDLEMCFGKIADDGTFTPRVYARTYGWGTNARWSFITELLKPSSVSFSSQKPRLSGNYIIRYATANTNYITLSNKTHANISNMADIYGIKLVERNGGMSFNWVTLDGTEIELSDCGSMDFTGINCVVYKGIVYDVSTATNVANKGFDPSRYYVANGTIDNVIVRMLDGTGKDSLSLKYSDDFKLNENNEISLNAEKIPTMPIGAIVPVNASSSYVPDGLLPCDGAEYSREQFKDFCKNYLDGEGFLNTCTYSQYEQELATYGQCSKFAVDGTSTIIKSGNVSTTLDVSHLILNLYPNGVELEFTYDGTNWTLDGNVVNLADYHITSSGTYKAGDTFKVSAGLVKKFRVPLIKDTETVVTNNIDYDNGIEIGCPISTAPFTAPCDGVYMTTLTKGNTNGYLYVNGVHTPFYRGDATGGDSWDNFFVPLSKGDVIYWEVTLTPKASHFYPYKEETKEKLKSFVVVANGQTNQSLMDWSAWASSLQGKANADLSNCTSPIVSAPYIVETSDKSILPSWYRVWSDGWCEQGGHLGTASATKYTVSFLKEFIDTNYSLISTDSTGIGENTDTGGASDCVYLGNYTTTSFTVSIATNRQASSWEAKGYIK